MLLNSANLLKNPVIVMQCGTTLSNPSLSILSPFVILETIIIQLSCSGWLLYSPRAYTSRKKEGAWEQIPKVLFITISPLTWPGALLQTWCSHHARGIPCKCRADTSVRQKDPGEGIWYKLPIPGHPSDLDATVFVKAKDQQIKTKRTETKTLLR